jgi:site-specific recombinase XerD
MTIESERGNRLGMTYQRQLLKYLRGWLNWLSQARYIGSNPWLDIRLGPVAKQPKPLDESEIEDLFAAHRSQAFSIPPFAFHRREVILVLLFGWGLRVRQLQSLNVAQMAATRDKVTVRDNRGGTKTFAYGPLPKASAGRWLRHRGVHAKFGEDALLIDQSGGRLSVDRIRAIVVDCGVRGGVTISPHRLSDTLGASLVDTTLPVERIMRLMGYADRDYVGDHGEVDWLRDAVTHSWLAACFLRPIRHRSFRDPRQSMQPPPDQDGRPRDRKTYVHRPEYLLYTYGVERRSRVRRFCVPRCLVLRRGVAVLFAGMNRAEPPWPGQQPIGF